VDTTLLIIVVAAVGLVCFLAGLVVARRRRQDSRMIVQQSPLAPDSSPDASPARRVAPGSVNLQLGRDLEQLLSAGKKIEAIKIVRERTGLSLKDAKDAVERLEDLMRSKLGRRD
jgi:large subunit ribosomal protein L7/L12